LLAVLLALIGIGGGIALLWARQRPQPQAEAQPEDVLIADVERQPRRPPVPDPALAHASSPAAKPVARAASLPLDPAIFRAYDIRGVVGTQLNADIARRIGQAIGGLMTERGLREIVVGRDGRLSGAELAGALSDGLRADTRGLFRRVPLRHRLRRVGYGKS